MLEIAQSTTSLAELSALVGVHLGIARVLVGDLIASNLVRIGTTDNADDGPELTSLENLLNDLIDY